MELLTRSTGKVARPAGPVGLFDAIYHEVADRLAVLYPRAQQQPIQRSPTYTVFHSSEVSARDRHHRSPSTPRRRMSRQTHSTSSSLKPSRGLPELSRVATERPAMTLIEAR